MSVAGLLTDWTLDGVVGLLFTLLTVTLGPVYLVATKLGRRRDRRQRRWPPRRTACFLAGLVVLVFATDSGVGTQADERLAAHMIEHILIWLLAAPLLVAGAPVRLTLFALGSSGRRRVARVLGSPTAKVVTGPARSTAAFSFLILISALPPLYDLTLRSELIHVGEHGLYVVAACLVWAPLIGADPLPHRPSAASRCACAAGCTFSMTLVSLWLLLAPAPVYRLNEQALGPLGALHDQRLAATIMLLAAVPGLSLALSARVGNVVRAADPPGGVSPGSRSTA